VWAAVQLPYGLCSRLAEVKGRRVGGSQALLEYRLCDRT